MQQLTLAPLTAMPTGISTAILSVSISVERREHPEAAVNNANISTKTANHFFKEISSNPLIS